MKIGFQKVGTQPIPFEISKGKLTFSGTLVKFSRSLIELEAKITGDLIIPCDICAEDFQSPIKESVKFHISDGICKDDDSEYDIIEIDNSIIDLDEILDSEVELLKSNYFSCPNCTNKD
jgi:uncharacterized metal-binding protein YceD (DUF177 family)